MSATFLKTGSGVDTYNKENLFKELEPPERETKELEPPERDTKELEPPETNNKEILFEEDEYNGYKEGSITVKRMASVVECEKLRGLRRLSC